MSAYLVFTSGGESGKVLSLPKDRPFKIGRRRTSDLVLQGDHVSRDHAEVHHEADQWYIRDLDSSNGTYVNDQKIATTAPLLDGCEIRIYGSRMRFSFTPNVEAHTPHDTPLSELINKTRLAVGDYTLLCAFMADAVDEQDGQQVIRKALQTILSETRASVAGYLQLDEAGEMPAGIIAPEHAAMDVQLSRSLTRQLKAKPEPIWLGQRNAEGSAESLHAYTDALCYPVVGAGKHLLGALHVYHQKGTFDERSFHFCQIVARHLAGCLRLDRLHRQLEAENLRLRQAAPEADRLVGSSQCMQEIRRLVARLARERDTVLIRGESGVGKELVALMLHKQRDRVDGPFVSANCANTGGDLVESLLFGHVKGAFSGAVQDRKGLLRSADGGTLFLDEIGELPLDCQAKLLRVLDGHGFSPLGSDGDVTSDVRFIAATNRDLEAAIQTGRFRKDLFFRLQVLEIIVPPLRERAEDVPEIVAHVLEHYATESGRKLRVQEPAMALLQRYRWPGNVRELWSMIRNAAISTEGDVIKETVLRLQAPGTTNDGLPTLNLAELEKNALTEALARTHNNVTETGKLLGVVRGTVYNMAMRYGINLD